MLGPERAAGRVAALRPEQGRGGQQLAQQQHHDADVEGEVLGFGHVEQVGQAPPAHVVAHDAEAARAVRSPRGARARTTSDGGRADAPPARAAPRRSRRGSPAPGRAAGARWARSRRRSRAPRGGRSHPRKRGRTRSWEPLASIKVRTTRRRTAVGGAVARSARAGRGGSERPREPAVRPRAPTVLVCDLQFQRTAATIFASPAAFARSGAVTLRCTARIFMLGRALALPGLAVLSRWMRSSCCRFSRV